MHGFQFHQTEFVIMKTLYPKCNHHIWLSKIFFSIITPPLLQCFQLCEINRAQSTTVEAKTKGRIWFPSWNSCTRQCSPSWTKWLHTKSDNITYVELAASFRTLQKPKLPPIPFVSSISFIPEQHSLFSCIYFYPFLPSKELITAS